MRKTRLDILLSLLSGLVLPLTACGGSGQNAQSPETSAAQDQDASAPVEAPASPEKPEAAPEAKRDPRDILLSDGTAFMIDHGKSDIGKKAEATCDKSAGDNVEKRASCISKAFNLMEREGYTFKKEGDAWYLIRFAVIKNRKQEYNHVQIDDGTVSDNSVTFKLSGPDTGSRRRGKAPLTMTFVVEDEYTILLEDPARGTLVLEPKMGILNE